MRWWPLDRCVRACRVQGETELNGKPAQNRALGYRVEEEFTEYDSIIFRADRLFSTCLDHYLTAVVAASFLVLSKSEAQGTHFEGS